MLSDKWLIVKAAVLDWIYPLSCLHCQEKCQSHLLCPSCIELLEPIDPSLRCKGCFSESALIYCNECLSHDRSIERIASVFDYLGPGPSLVKKLKYANQSWLATAIAAWMVQYHTEVLRWPLPDLIIPTPISWNKKLMRGFNHSELIAQEISRFLQVPISNVLRRKAGDLSQARLDKEQRMSLSAQSFFLKKPESLYDKHLLLVDDVTTTGMTLRRCGEILLEGCPASISALTFCRARD